MSSLVTVHQLKTWPIYFEEVLLENKTFEIRQNDRKFQVGDLVLLREWDPDTQKYTGRQLTRWISYITSYGQPGDQVVLAIKTHP
jgi:hypothetical protein